MNYKSSILLSSSEKRLNTLIEERLKAGSNKALIDERIWDLFGEEWCIMFTDLSGFSRSVAKFGIIHFLQTIVESEKILVPIIEDYDGILLKTEGDSLLVIFRNPKKAVNAAIAMQQTLLEYNKTREEEEKVLLCVGLGFGKVLRIGDSDVFGEEVNMSSKLGEDTAKAYEILITESVKKQVEEIENLSFEEIPEVFKGSSKAYKLIY